MVRVPGSLGDSEFHRESPQEDTHSEFGQGYEASSDIGSPTTLLNPDRSAERQSSGRSSTDGTEESPVMDLEDKPRPPPQVPSGTPAGLDENLAPLDESPPAQAGTNTSTQPRSARSTAKTKTSKAKPLRKKIKAPDSETEDRGNLIQSQLQSTLTVARSTPIVAPGDQIAASSPYVSATEEVESSDSEEPPCMTLGPAGAAMLQDRAKQVARLTPIKPRDTLEAVVNSDRHPPEKLELFFQAAKERFLKEQQVPQTRPKPRSTGDQDVEMESVGSPDQPITTWEYDPDDLDLGQPARAIVATTTATTSGQATNTPRIRVSAMSELQEFAGKDGDEDRARSWLGKVKAAFIRDQAPDQEKCLVFGGLLTVPARNWYRQLSRTTRSTWKDLHQSFQVQYCERGVSVTRQYYHARKRSDESPLEYLHRLNVAGLRTRLQVKDGPPDVRREHVEHFIETLDDRDLADQLALIRIPDADTLEEVQGSLIDNTCGHEKESATAIVNLHQTDEYSRSEVKMILDITPGESRVYWKYHVPDKKFKQAKAVSKINNAKATLLLDSGAEVSILDTAFARYYEIDTGGSEEVRLRTGPSDRQKIWVTRGDRWVPTYVAGPGRSCYLRLTNVSERKLILHGDTKITMWHTGDRVPRLPRYVSVGVAKLRRMAEPGLPGGHRRKWRDPEARGSARASCGAASIPNSYLDLEAASNLSLKDHGIDSLRNAQGLQLPLIEANCTQIATSRAHGATNNVGICSAHVIQNQGQGTPDPDQQLNTRANQWRDQRRVDGRAANPDAVDPGDKEVYIKESGDLYAEDVEGHLAVLPEVTPTIEEVNIEDIQVGDPNDNTQEQVDRLRHIIWRRRHLLIGKGNALPPAAKGAICDIDVGNAKSVAQRVRKVAPQFREKLIQLIKGLLSAKIIQHSTSPWTSPVVVIIKKNGIDIRLCSDYRLDNSLTRLMVYPMPLINDLLDDLDKVLWYCSLDMASGFWVVSMPDRARAISAFITPIDLFEWKRMPFGLKNAPQIYQRLLDNALNGFLRITNCQHVARRVSAFFAQVYSSQSIGSRGDHTQPPRNAVNMKWDLQKERPQLEYEI
ncbi:unnamed protein product [Phytophthora fragariaefolia]|uniref:Unnamed protein product n=1 Tax=Phytophthora fragariaefolia TaxID=1490495 RepID=A0A9W7DAF6_9STRA|nr:unnamed protein product [Phytophthora fragariaefolia]